MKTRNILTGEMTETELDMLSLFVGYKDTSLATKLNTGIKNTNNYTVDELKKLVELSSVISAKASNLHSSLNEILNSRVQSDSKKQTDANSQDTPKNSIQDTAKNSRQDTAKNSQPIIDDSAIQLLKETLEYLGFNVFSVQYIVSTIRTSGSTQSLTELGISESLIKTIDKILAKKLTTRDSILSEIHNSILSTLSAIFDTAD